MGTQSLRRIRNAALRRVPVNPAVAALCSKSLEWDDSVTISISIDEFQTKTPEIVRNVLEGEETVVVRLADGRSFALVPDVDYQSFDETAYLNSAAANRAALARSLQESSYGKTVKVAATNVASSLIWRQISQWIP